MCILSLFIKNGSFILTHNRDEDALRASSDVLCTKTIHGQKATYPVDMQSKGTWILTSEKFTTAILNGANHLHKRQPPYLHSRGLFPLKLIEINDIDLYIQHLELENIEPFSQMIIQNETLHTTVLQWDGSRLNSKIVHENLCIMSSSTLYTPQRKLLNEELIKGIKNPTTDKLAQIHANLKWKFNIDLPQIKTTSITQIFKCSAYKSMKYKRF